MGFRPWLVDIMLMNNMDETAVGKHVYVLASCWHGATYWSGALPLAAERHPFVLSLHLFHLFFSARIGVMSHMTCHVDAGVDKGQTSQAHSHLSPAPMQSFLTPSDPK